MPEPGLDASSDVSAVSDASLDLLISPGTTPGVSPSISPDVAPARTISNPAQQHATHSSDRSPQANSASAAPEHQI